MRRVRCPEVYWTISLGQRNSNVHLDERGWEISPSLTKASSCLIHRVVASTFLKDPSHKGDLLNVHHLGDYRDKSNSDPRYLVWLGHMDNVMEDYYRTLRPDTD